MFQTSGRCPLEENSCSLTSFHGIVRRQLWAPYGIISLECAPRALGSDDLFPVSHFLLYQSLLCSLFGVGFRCVLAVCAWAMLILNIQWCN